MKDHAKKPSREPRAVTEAWLDEAIEETFPASDPPATSPTSVGRPDRSRASDDRKRGEPPEAQR